MALALEDIWEGKFSWRDLLDASFKLNSKTLCSYLIQFYPTFIMLIERVKISLKRNKQSASHFLNEEI